MMFKGHDGLQLFHQSWMIDEPQANIYIIHGLGEHSGRYHREAALFNEAGFSVYAYDHRGHGKSEGLQGYVNNFQEFTKDLGSYLNEFFPTDLPGFIYGHSNGALILLDYLARNNFGPDNLKGIITTSAAVKVSEDIAPILQKISPIVGKILPKLRTISIDSNFISRIPEEVKMYQDDPLVHHKGIYARMGAEMLRMNKSIGRSFHKFDYPVLVMYGENDQLIDPKGSIEFYETISSQDKELVPWEGGYHEITRDIDSKAVCQKMIDWATARL